MKKVEELGISPPPWEEDKETKVIWGGDYSVHGRSYRHHYQSMEDANARLIAAAPELYRRLFNIVDWLKRMNEQRLDAWATSEGNPSSSFRRETFAQLIEDNKYHIEMGIQALAKATGEEKSK